MAKKKRRKKRAPAAYQGGQTADRAARKEAARRERERAIRAYRRRRLLKRVAVIGLAVLVVAVVVFLIWNTMREDAARRERVEGIAAQLGCGSVLTDDDELDDEGAGHVAQPPEYQNVPATSGSHSAQTLPPEVSVYDQPFDPAFEFRAVHNLEHGYVIMYYRDQGEGALDEGVRAQLAQLAEREDQVILAPHPGLEADENLVLVAWNRARRCDVTAGTPEDVESVQLVAEDFIERFRDGPEAPEAQVD